MELIGIGDVVKLNSGSPELKVVAVKASVEWTDNVGNTKSEEFPIECLSRIRTSVDSTAQAEITRYRDALKRHGFTSDADIEAFLR